VYAQDVQNIDADTAKVAKSGYNRISVKTGKLFFRGLTGTKKEVVSTNNSYANPTWIPSLALSKITGLQDSISKKIDKVAGKGLSANDFSSAEKTKLAGIAIGATANSTDATLLARANHTGTQTSSTISDFNTAADARVVAGITGKANLAGDNTFTGVNTFQNSIGSSTTNFISNNASFANLYLGSVSNPTYAGIVVNNSSLNLGIHLGGAERLRIFNNGNVNIGSTTDTGEKLQVNGTVKFKSDATGSTTFPLTLQNANNAPSSGVGMQFITDGALVGSSIVGLRVASAGPNHALQFNVSFAERMRIDTDGRLGIGTTAPNAKLDVTVTSTGTAQGIAITNTNAVAGGVLGIDFIPRNTLVNGYSAIRATGFTGTSSDLSFHTSTGGVQTQKMTIDGNGTVGIGATTPNLPTLLDVASTTKGSMPFPRMTSTQRLAIASPTVGLHVYQTDMVEGVYVYKSIGWAFAY
jgi:hypothetical protein